VPTVILSQAIDHRLEDYYRNSALDDRRRSKNSEGVERLGGGNPVRFFRTSEMNPCVWEDAMLWEFLDRALARRHPAKSKDEIRAEIDERHDTIGRSIAKRYTRGNVNIKRGAFLTREDLDARKDRK
jgi:hypothetical protein